MKQVKLKTLTIVNFKGHKSTMIDFTDQTIISGENATGKSTIFDAFVWLQFGKDQFDRKDFEIIPTINNVQLEKVDPEVSAIIDFDGREMELKRVYHQKWVRKRGASEETFDGCETLYYINDVPLKAGEYKARVDLIIEETIFKLITNPSAFLDLHWQKQREFLFQIAGTVSDAQIAASDPRFAALLDMVNGKSMSDFKKELSARKKKLKADLDDIQPRIDQTTRLMPANSDFEAIEKEIAEVDEKIKAIDEQLADRAKAIRGQYDAIQAKQKEINDLKTRKMDIVNEAIKAERQKAFEKNQERQTALNNVTSHLSQLKNAEIVKEGIQKLIESYNSAIADKNRQLNNLRSDWDEENKKEYNTGNGCIVCPIFSHECADLTALNHKAEGIKLGRYKFIELQTKKLDEIEGKAAGLKGEIAAYTNKIEAETINLNEATKAIEEAEAKYNESNEAASKMEEVQPAIIDFTTNEEYTSIYAKINEIEDTIEEVKPADNSDLTGKKSELTTKRDELKKKLSDRDLIVRYRKEVERLNEESKSISQQIADLEKQEFTIDAFTKAKIDECDKRINGMFQIVKFKLFDKTIEGNEFEVCIPTNKAGVPISATNTAEKINAGLDIINVLSRFYNVSAPIFCDQAESNNNYLRTEAQMVFLKVTKEPVLTITNY